MREAAQVLELSWFAYTADFVFDVVGQTGVKLVTKGGVAITLELRREAVELHDCNGRILSLPSYLISMSILSNLGAHLISYLIYGCGLVSS